MPRFASIVPAVALGLCLVGCMKKNADVSTSSPPPTPPPAAMTPPPPATAAAPAAPTPVAAPGVVPGAAGAGGVAGAGSAAPGAEGAAVAETTAKLAKAQWAMRQDEIKNDPDGQWVSGATASSTYGDAKEKERFSAGQVIGPPDVEKYSDDAKAWAPKTEDGGIEWLDLKFANAVHAREVRIRESDGSGAVVKVELFDTTGASHVVWMGSDPTTELNYLILKFTPTDYLTDRVKVTLATNVIPGWNEIDAVQLVGKP
jgi:hypothetical protein